jgi:hypothetical protein
VGLKGRSSREPCYLIRVPWGWTPTDVWVKLKKKLAFRRGVYRITDHVTHLKINSHVPLPGKVAGCTVVVAEDKTEHTDERYWDFAMDAMRYCMKSGMQAQQAAEIVVHYIANAMGLAQVEAEFFLQQAGGRALLDKVCHVEQLSGHGWEVDALIEAGVW